MTPTYSMVVENLRSASIPVHEMGARARVAVIQPAGRVIAMAFSPDDPNLLWSHPHLADTHVIRNSPQTLIGGFGGDRLWFAPEVDFHWEGPPDWLGFQNYRVPDSADPGTYRVLESSADAITLNAHGALPVRGSSRIVGFEVTRTVRLTDPPRGLDGSELLATDYVGVETEHVLRIDEHTRGGVVGLWHLLQIPAGSVLIVPLKKDALPQFKQPLSYGLPGDWVQRPDHLMWRFGGAAQAKLGMSAAGVSGRSGVLCELGLDRWCLIVREFPVDIVGSYADHPYNDPRDDQVFQAWDGYGFGEMEFHSTALNAERGPRELRESDRLWLFGGSANEITLLASKLLGIDVTYIFDQSHMR